MLADDYQISEDLLGKRIPKNSFNFFEPKPELKNVINQSTLADIQELIDYQSQIERFCDSDNLFECADCNKQKHRRKHSNSSYRIDLLETEAI